MISLFGLLPLTVLPLVVSQSANSTAFQIEAIEAHFSAARIVPSLLSTFYPSAILTVAFDGVGVVAPGQNIIQDLVKPAPQLSIEAANSSVGLTGNFTLAMVDAGPVGTEESKGVTRHWLVNGVTISGSMLSNASATAITQYAGPAPPSGSGPHRYTLLLYSQPPGFVPPAGFTMPNIGVSVFSLTDYVKNSGLGPVIAGMYFQVENGQATVSLSATSAVVSSTLAPVHASGTSTTAATSTSSSNGVPDLQCCLSMTIFSAIMGWLLLQ